MQVDASGEREIFVEARQITQLGVVPGLVAERVVGCGPKKETGCRNLSTLGSKLPPFVGARQPS